MTSWQVLARKPARRADRYCIRLSRVLTRAVSWARCVWPGWPRIEAQGSWIEHECAPSQDVHDGDAEDGAGIRRRRLVTVRRWQDMPQNRKRRRSVAVCT